MSLFRSSRRATGFLLAAAAALAAGASGLLAVCGPFTDVTDPSFCANVLEIFTLGITTGTTPTTYSPGDPVTRLQMATFLSREADRLLLRGSRRAALKQFWTPGPGALPVTLLAGGPAAVRSDGTDLWVSDNFDGSVWRVRGSDGRLLQTWTGASGAEGVLVAMGNIFVTGYQSPGKLYRLDPVSPFAVTTVASNLGNQAGWAAFDGLRIWTSNHALPGSVSIVTPTASVPWTVTTVTVGFQSPIGVLYNGSNIWVSDINAGALMKLDGSGAILQTVTLPSPPVIPVYDGANIWVPAGGDVVFVVRASNGAILATLTGNGLNQPYAAAFDGQRVMVTDLGGDKVSLWNAASLTPLGSVGTGGFSAPAGVCSDGVSFWIVLSGTGQLARF